MNLHADLMVLLPELILAVGAMALLLAGAVGGEKSAPAISWGAIALLAAAGWAASGWARTRRSPSTMPLSLTALPRFAKLLILSGAAMSILLADEFFASIKLSRFELPVLMLLASLGMMLMVSSNSFLSLYMGLELQSLALYVLAAFNRDNLRSDRSGPQIFRPGRPVVRHAALRHLADLWLHRFDRVRGHRQGHHRQRRQPGRDLRHRVPDRGPGLQGLGRAVPYVDARRVRGRADARSPPISPPPPRSRRCACSCAPS